MRKIGLGKFISLVKKAVGKKEPYATNQEETPHVNFFTMSALKKDLHKNNLFVYEKKKAFVFASIIETYLPMVPLQKIANIDNWIAQRLPFFLVSGWYFCIKRKR